jgi:flagellar motor protein MotB
MLLGYKQQAHGPSGGESGEGGGYLASTADLMIGLLFIFVILVVILAIKAQEPSPDDPRKVLTQTLGSGLTGKFPGIRIDAETGVISLPEEVLFTRGSAVLTQQGLSLLADVARELESKLPCFVENQRRRLNCSSNPENHQVETIFIEGHTDSVPFAAGPRDNFDLSLQRARSVEQALVSETLKTFRNRSSQPLFSLSAYADTRPIKGTDPADGKNRRVDLRLVLHYKSLQEMMQGSRLKVGP